MIASTLFTLQSAISQSATQPSAAQVNAAGQNLSDPIQSALNQLQDIQLPAQISTLPIAPGYWLILLCGLLLLGYFAYRLIKRSRYHLPRKQALQMVNSLSSDSINFAADINAILKRISMTYLPRELIANLNGEPWFSWLDSRLPEKSRGQIGLLLIKRHQAAGLTQEDNQQLKQLAQTWLANKSPFDSKSLQEVKC